ncbi:MAG: BamA/TamA family outer membrane protein [Bacteroidota bacterium]
MIFILVALNDIRKGFRYWPLLALGIFLALTACNSSKFLAEDEELLVKQRVVLGDANQVDNRSQLSYELSGLARQQPNGNFLFLWPREYIYLSSNRAKDSTRFDRFKRNTLGQEPTIFSDSLTQLAVDDMTAYLKYRGYFNAEVYPEIDHYRRQRLGLTYHTETGRRTFIDSVAYSSPQADIDSLLQLTLQKSLLKKGEPLNLTQFDLEKERIGRFLRNEGYAFFSNTYFDKLEIDTFQQAGLADIYLQVLPPQGGGVHRRFQVGSVEVYPDFQAGDFFSPYGTDSIVQGVQFRFRSNDPQVRLTTLINNIFLRPNTYYSKEEIDKTREQLALLGIYRFVRITHQIDPSNPNVLNFVLQLTPNYKMEFGVDLDVNYTNRLNNTNSNLIGLSLSPTFQNRNLFGGGELLSTSLRAGVEFNPSFGSSDNPFVNTVDLGAEANVYLPRFRDFGLYRFLYNLPLTKDKHLLNERFYRGLQDRATTRFSLAYEYLLIRDFYAYTLANARLGYNYTRSATSTYGITHLALDILVPSTQPQFDTILAENQFLQRSFGEQFFVSLLFRELSYQRIGRANRRGQSLSITGDFEIAGLEIFAANKLVNALRNDSTVFRPRANASYAQYWRFESNLSYYQTYSPNSSLAGRFNLGFGRPFGNGAAVPYVKQFFAGGANSMRAWAPRGLGPGGFVDPESLDPENNLRLYQTGDLKLELNLEYRFKLLWQLRGALFLDIGNVWSLSPDKERPGSQFLLRRRESGTVDDGDYFNQQSFLRQMGIGGGMGVRIDLSYFIFRLDMAVPLRYNSPSFSGDRRTFLGDVDDPRTILDEPVLERYYWNQFERFRLRDITFQLGLGYPF